VHSKAHESWIQVSKISTADGRFGSSRSSDLAAQKKLDNASVGWDFRKYAAQPYIEQPLRTSGSISFPEKVSYDAKRGRYELRYHTSWEVASAETVLYVNRSDLVAAFDKMTVKPRDAPPK
jgi:hypothetical protein